MQHSTPTCTNQNQQSAKARPVPCGGGLLVLGLFLLLLPLLLHELALRLRRRRHINEIKGLVLICLYGEARPRGGRGQQARSNTGVRYLCSEGHTGFGVLPIFFG
jgi:hypothetical protein